MSASEGVREAVQWLMATGELQRLVRDEIAPVVAEAMVNEAIVTARAEGYRAGLEAAADECKERAVLHDAVEEVHDMLMYREASARGREARECESAIRALAKEA